MDVNMPVMTGIEAAKIFRFNELGRPYIPVIALTADATPEMEARTSEAGMDACLTKPVQSSVLLGLIEQITNSGVSDSHPAQEGQDNRRMIAVSSSPPSLPMDGASAIDEQTLRDLEKLGGQEFLSSLIQEFLTDADLLISQLRNSAIAVDSIRFRANAHALQSTAANIGAKAIFKLCFDWQKISDAELARNGLKLVELLAQEVERARQALLEQDLAKSQT
jgi:two-component system sensor histidine kinase RpfC